MSNPQKNEPQSEEIKKQKTKISKENHSEIERRRRFTMNHYISQLSEIFSKGDISRQKLKKITILKYTASYLQKLREQEKAEDFNNLSFVKNDEQVFMTYDAICGFKIKIECNNGIILDVSDSVDYVCCQNYFIGKSIYNFIYPDDCRKMFDQINLHNFKSFQVFDFKRGLSIVESENHQRSFKHRRFYARMQILNCPSINKEYFCPENKLNYKFVNYQFAQDTKLSYEFGDFVLVEFSGSLELSLEGRINYMEKNDEMFFGFTEKEILTFPMAMFIHPEDRSLFLEVLELAKNENKSTNYFLKSRFMNKNGTFTALKLRLKCVTSIFSSIPEFYVLLVEQE
ncbi:Aryl hydrocarbon receptor nuclear translocator [Thelohanellus kitauei]|uniref:Aryl hydrocarbon receptor nuclear translocator n=1 Tax=Thelohanellus kitauei TaxID=669202 RepID=A0A0C2N1B1_THEKT|nr:Aryl hydrocarbon receptor nuclear translocator [Thelohanellus kitauei]